MSKVVLALILASITLSSFAQILMKLGMSSKPVQLAISDQSIWKAGMTVATSVPVLAGLLAYGVGALIWLAVLSKVDVSLAYPFVSLGFVMVVLLSALLLGEHITPMRLIGLGFIVLGVVLVGRTAAI